MCGSLGGWCSCASGCFCRSRLPKPATPAGGARATLSPVLRLLRARLLGDRLPGPQALPLLLLCLR